MLSFKPIVNLSAAGGKREEKEKNEGKNIEETEQQCSQVGTFVKSYGSEKSCNLPNITQL